ncbi:lysine N(6)-hydroxylase/L-ornithine N(5)-oxygenase family protein [Psychromonas algicola]|uniref:lysine N(6)-hydroxylase/L-ornithine N(5)-oxygenase family protein n=1 Tax=Psychromonas algicola TaxID=2555642 RepID=UPI001068066E|nr:SidA/IucD/PvdA family monooxygenase [Psychromonas sp. RZ5]TEW51786.1 lysine 6-monooxygenase [Psychromonas sp. RZ5]
MKQLTDLIGVGVGPFNLSVAALLEQVPHLSSQFFDNKKEFVWHEGLMLPNTYMQTSYLKDLVTAVAPESPYSFMSYLVKNKKFYRFLNTEMQTITRAEFSDYLAWTAKQINGIHFSHAVKEINHVNDRFVVTTSQGDFEAKNLCLGTGKSAYVPDYLKANLGDNCFHASEMGVRNIDLTDKKVVLVGGGQTGADIFLNALRGHWGQPLQLDWVSRRANFQALDEAAFANEFFVPQYVEQFYHLDPSVKKREVDAQKLTSDGITSEALKAIYQELYDKFEVQKQDKWVRLLPHRTVTSMTQNFDGFNIEVKNNLTGFEEKHTGTVVILATGFETKLPACLAPIMDKLSLCDDGLLQLDQNFKVHWKGNPENSIYAVNAGLGSHGIADPQLSLAAWRSAKIINDLASESCFDITESCNVMNWGTEETIMPFSTASLISVA